MGKTISEDIRKKQIKFSRILTRLFKEWNPPELENKKLYSKKSVSSPNYSEPYGKDTAVSGNWKDVQKNEAKIAHLTTEIASTTGKKSYSKGSVKDWLSGRSLPTDRTITAIVRLFEDAGILKDKVKNNMLSCTRKPQEKNLAESKIEAFREVAVAINIGDKVKAIRKEVLDQSSGKFARELTEKLTEAISKREENSHSNRGGCFVHNTNSIHQIESGNRDLTKTEFVIIADMGKLPGEIRSDYFHLAAKTTLAKWREAGNIIPKKNASIPVIEALKYFELDGKEADNFINSALKIYVKDNGVAETKRLKNIINGAISIVEITNRHELKDEWAAQFVKEACKIYGKAHGKREATYLKRLVDKTNSAIKTVKLYNPKTELEESRNTNIEPHKSKNTVKLENYAKLRAAIDEIKNGKKPVLGKYTEEALEDTPEITIGKYK